MLALNVAVEGAKKAGAVVTLLSLKDFEMPIYNGDYQVEFGLPENAKKLKRIFLAHDRLLLACPEYNSSITPVLKNALDWVSRPMNDEEDLACYKHKVAALISASPGNLGGLRGLVHVRSLLGNIGVIVLPQQISIPKAHEAFDHEGNFKDAKMQKKVEAIGECLATFIYPKPRSGIN